VPHLEGWTLRLKRAVGRGRMDVHVEGHTLDGHIDRVLERTWPTVCGKHRRISAGDISAMNRDVVGGRLLRIPR